MSKTRRVRHVELVQFEKSLKKGLLNNWLLFTGNNTTKMRRHTYERVEEKQEYVLMMNFFRDIENGTF